MKQGRLFSKPLYKKTSNETHLGYEEPHIKPIHMGYFYLECCVGAKSFAANPTLSPYTTMAGPRLPSQLI